MDAAVTNPPNVVEALKALVVLMTQRATDAEAVLAGAVPRLRLIRHPTLQTKGRQSSGGLKKSLTSFSSPAHFSFG